jgi:hypothetical protein
MPDVLANRIGGIVDREFLPHAADCATSTYADAAKRRVASRDG